MELSKPENNAITPEVTQKIRLGLTDYVYAHVTTSIFASLFCASIILYGLYNPHNQNIIVPWYLFVLAVTGSRYLLTKIYLRQSHPEKHLTLWNNLFVLGSILGGLSWGIVSYFLFPAATPFQQTLTIMIIAGVIAGGVPALAAIKASALSFLVLTLLPLIVQIFQMNNNIYSLFNLTVTVYLLYMAIFSIRTHHMIKNIIQLQYENILLLQKLRFLSTHDPLTNLDNSRLFYDTLSCAIKRAHENDKLLALLYIDLDKFKSVNDHFGHDIGDRLLKYTAARIKRQLRKGDVFARLGGDEFAVMLEQVIDQENIVKIAKRICETLEKPIILDGNEIHISASIGISIYPMDALDMTTLIKAADRAMYYVKKNGSKNFHFSKERLPEKIS